MAENEEQDDTHPDEAKFLKLLASVGFPDRYYAYCSEHAERGPDIPLATQQAALAATGRTFRYDKKEKFFAWRDADGADDGELGLNVSLRDGRVEWILVFATAPGHLGDTFANMALNSKRLAHPAYKHSPPYPTPKVSSKAELDAVIEEGLALYDDLAKHLAARKWT
jgi:hypothetical protein